MNELYAPLLERDLDSIPQAARAYLESHSEEELWLAVARYAVLAYAPSQHAKRAVMAALAAHQVRDEVGERWVELVIECARYASEARQPWSEPPILDPPEPLASATLDDLRSAIAEGDRTRAERWLAARVDDCEDDLRALAKGDALLMLETVLGLLPLLGEKGRYALLRMVIHELPGEESSAALDPAGAPDSVQAAFVRIARSARPPSGPVASPHRLEPYRLARDYAQTLIAHAWARRLPPGEAVALLDAVHHNLEHGESYADFSFA